MTLFARVRAAAAAGAALAVASMLAYPGGTPREPSAHGYSLTRNFLSDLGATVTYGGARNYLGATLFVLGVTVGVVGFGTCLVGLTRLYGATPATRRLVRAAAVVGALVCALFVGVALTPEDRSADLHVLLSCWAFRLFPLVALLIAIASARDGRFPRRVAIGWALLGLALVAYVVVLDLGPRAATDGGLATQVIAQKLIVVTLLVALVYQSVEAERVAARA